MKDALGHGSDTRGGQQQQPVAAHQVKTVHVVKNPKQAQIDAAVLNAGRRLMRYGVEDAGAAHYLAQAEKLKQGGKSQLDAKQSRGVQKAIITRGKTERARRVQQAKTTNWGGPVLPRHGRAPKVKVKR